MIAVLSDVHGNLAALEAVFDELDREGVERIWFLGDCVGYGARPNECAAILSKRAERSLMGNHDLACLGRLDMGMFNTTIQRSWRLLQELLSDETKEWLGGLEPVDAPSNDLFGLFHGSPRDPVWEYVVSPAEFRGALSSADNEIILVGHSHIPFAVSEKDGRFANYRDDSGGWVDISGGRFIINPGSVGQPRDGDPRASYALIDEERMRLSHRRVDYDIEQTQREIIECGLPESNATRLADGN